jgi:hypothetical protein
MVSQAQATTEQATSSVVDAAQDLFKKVSDAVEKTVDNVVEAVTPKSP